MHKLSESEENFRLKLYAKGLNDREIGEMVERASTSIASWRWRRELPPNYNPLFIPKTPQRRFFEYLLGVVHGDGYVRTSHNGKSYLLSIAVKCPEYAEVLKRILEKAYDYTPHGRIHNNCLYLEVYPKKIVRSFLDYKAGEKWAIPELKYPEEYLAGLWDTDGYLYFGFHEYKNKNNETGKEWSGVAVHRKIELRQKSNGNLKLITHLLLSLGLNPRPVKTYVYKNKWGEFEADVLRIPSCDYVRFWSTIPIKHPRKIAILKKIAGYKRRWRNQWRGGSKLTREQVDTINILHRAGLTQKEMAQLFDVSCTTIRRYRSPDGYVNKYLQRKVFLALETPKRSRDLHKELGIPRKSIPRILKGLKSRRLVICMTPNKTWPKFYGLTTEGKNVFKTLKRFAHNNQHSFRG